VDLFLRFKDLHDPAAYSQDGTPLGEYAGAKLAISVTPPNGTAVTTQLKSVKSMLSGMPHGSADVSDQAAGLGAWTIEVQNQDIAALPASLRTDGGANKIYRLNSDAVADLIILCHYSATSTAS